MNINISHSIHTSYAFFQKITLMTVTQKKVIGIISFIFCCISLCYATNYYLKKYKIKKEDPNENLIQKPLSKKDSAKYSDKHEIAAIKIQTQYRKYLASKLFKKLKKETFDKQVHEGNLSKIKKLFNEIEENEQVKFQEKGLEKDIDSFITYELELRLSNAEKHISIQNTKDVELLLKMITEHISNTHRPIIVHFKNMESFSEKIEKIVSDFSENPFGQSLEFRLSPYDFTLSIHPKPVKTEALIEGSIRHAYTNGIIEVFKLDDLGNLRGCRVFPTGKTEEGEFDKESGQLLSGYRTEKNDKIEFIDPKKLVFCTGTSEDSEWMVCEVKGKLVVIEKNEIVDVPLIDVLLKASSDSDRSIKYVLLHKDFDKFRDQFIKCALAVDKDKTPKLFNFSNITLLELLEAALLANYKIDPLKIIDVQSGRNLFIHTAYIGHISLLHLLIENFSQIFSSNGQDVIAALLHQGHSEHDINNIAKKYESLGNKLDAYHKLWIEVAHKASMKEQFRDVIFDHLTNSQKKVLYDAAYIYENVSLYEPAQKPIQANQYSINLMWINKNKAPESQDFLLGDGDTTEKRLENFRERFAEPVSNWAKANPGTFVNIWIDSEMISPKAIENSRNVLLKNMFDKTSPSPTSLRFRDIRSLSLVKSNPQIFSEKLPLFFRVDLLRPIAADEMLKNKEIEFFVYGDIDMKPLSGRELFDQRTLNALNDVGIVLAKKSTQIDFENGFQILSNKNKKFFASHKKMIIDLNIAKAYEFLAKKSRLTASRMQQTVYESYSSMFVDFFNVDGRFGQVNSLDLRRKKSIPTKVVVLPPSQFE